MTRVAVLVGAVFLLAACGGGGDNPDADQVKQVWTSFFAASTPVSKKLTLLQDGQRFKSTVESLAANRLASSLSVKVTSVTLQGANKAKVVFTLMLGKGALNLPNVVGYAYKQNGKWVVGYAGLCKLVGLSGSTPAACKS